MTQLNQYFFSQYADTPEVIVSVGYETVRIRKGVAKLFPGSDIIKELGGVEHKPVKKNTKKAGD